MTIATPGTVDAAQVSAFLRAIYGAVPDDRWLCFWESREKSSFWQQRGLLDLETFTYSVPWPDRDVYVGCAVTSTAGPVNRRIAAERATGLPALWSELDVADPTAHKGTGLCPSIEEAIGWAQTRELPPTRIVHSGHGLHLWWVLEEFWDLTDPAENARARAAMQAFQQRLREAAAPWKVDATHDLARVLRVPGTWNWKGPPQPVTLLDYQGRSYALGDVLEYAGTVTTTQFALGWPDEQKVAAGDDYQGIDVRLDPATSIALERLEALLESDDMIRATWEGRRADFGVEGHKGSQSEYDLSLATAVRHWPDQDVCDLLVQFRRERAAQAKPLSYYQRTIARARESSGMRQARLAAAGAAPSAASPPAAGDAPSAASPPAALPLEVLRRRLRVDLQRIERHGSEPAHWRFVGPSLRSAMLTTRQLRTRDDALAALTDATLESPLDVPPKEWREEVVPLILRAAELVDDGGEGTDASIMADWLAAWLDRSGKHQQPLPEGLDDTAWRNGDAFQWQGDVCVRRTPLVQHLQAVHACRWPSRQITEALAAAGWHHAVVTVTLTDTDERKQVAVWRRRAHD